MYCASSSNDLLFDEVMTGMSPRSSDILPITQLIGGIQFSRSSISDHRSAALRLADDAAVREGSEGFKRDLKGFEGIRKDSEVAGQLHETVMYFMTCMIIMM